MLAPKVLPDTYQQFNRDHKAPAGNALLQGRVKGLARHSALGRRLLGPYSWQPNNSIRAFEYPWAFEQIQRLGSHLVIADIGASLAGMQFTLAQHGHDVHAIDPGMNATGRGWAVPAEFHKLLGESYRAPVRLHPTTLGDAELADGSVDVVMSISTIEHFGPGDLAEFARSARRVLKPGGHLVLTIDLFLDLEPFTGRRHNEFGENVDIADLLEQVGAELVEGKPEELYGFPEFDARKVQENLAAYLLGTGYPAMAQCLVARLT